MAENSHIALTEFTTAAVLIPRTCLSVQKINLHLFAAASSCRRKNMKCFIVCLSLITSAAASLAASVEEITQLVTDGHWQQARQDIAGDLAQTNLDFKTREALLFQQDRMQRMALDFDKTRAQALAQARSVVPSITDEQFATWEKAGAVETLDVDGTRWYYDGAGRNLFRINPEARKLKADAHRGDDALYRLNDIRSAIADYGKTGSPLHLPHTWRVTYSLTVKPDMVPAGEIVRAWLPIPHAANRQQNIRIVSTDPAQHVPSDTNAGLASVYLEKLSAGHQPTEFQVVCDVTTEAYYQPIDPARVQPADASDPALAPFMGEEPPHIVFSDHIKKLSHDLVGDETNPYLKARRIFGWVYTNIPWTTAREYSTIECLPKYALAGGHGDCGIKSMTLMTLCRCCGIPARWESGWTTDPVKDMHDWCEIYLAPYGWVPVDVTYGVTDSTDEHEKWFYLGGIDALRFFVNTDYNQPLYPAKTFYRSEIVDFQRGEAEWRGGNLYFNQWSYNFEVAEVPQGK
jgi:transglutaminase-like putative cysteine protease